MNNNILIVSQSHLCRNPRTAKEALALAAAGYQVTILTAIYSNDLLIEDMDLLADTAIQYKFYSDLRKPGFRAFADRLVRRIATEINALLHIENKRSLGFGVNRLKKMCLAQKPALYIMHQEIATIIGCELIKKGYKIVFDIEDWYAEDLLPEARRKRPVQLLKISEKFALQKSTLCYTTSQAMATGMAAHYHVNRIPEVIYNSFPAINHLSPGAHNSNMLRLYWFSQTIGPGRGLEFFIISMAGSRFSFNLTLRGNVNDAYKAFLYGLVASKDKIVFKPILKNTEILDDMTNYDIGLALEPDVPYNKNLTISNKFFHYMSAGLPIIASETLGHKEIRDKHPGLIFMYGQHDAQHLIDILNQLGNIAQATGLNNLKQEMLQLYTAKYCWEIEKEKLAGLIKQIFQSKAI